MSIRRRRKKLTSLISSLDRDIRSTTLRQVKRQTAPAASDVTEEDETTTTTEPPVGTVIAVDPPDQWAKVIGGYYYPPTRTGGLGQVELFISEDLQLSTLDKMYVSGTEVKWNQTSAGKTYTGSFRPNTSSYESTTTIRVVSQYGNPAWSTRAASTKPTYAAIPSSVTNSILYTVTNKDTIPSRVTLSFRGTVASYYATTTTATITFTAAHHFVAGHIVDVSDLGSPMKDVDGIVKITAVPSSTQISYEFTNPLGSSISSTTPSTTSYVNAVVSKYTTIGSSWIDSSVTPNKVWIWDGLRWVGYTDALADGLVTDDMVAPAPPSGLSLTTLGYVEEGVLGKVSKSSVALSWTAPTTNAEGNALNDLAGYRIWYSTTSATGPWIGKQNFGQETSQTIVGLTPEITYYFRVIAFDTTGRDSTGITDSIITEKTAISVQKPSAPTLTARLGTIKVQWNGKDYDNADTPLSLLAYVEVHYSTSTGFTPSESTLLGKIYGGPGFVVATDLTYNTDYYFKLVAVDINKRSTDSSAQATAKVVPLVDADLIAAKLNAPLSSWPFAPKAVTAGALADGSLDASTVFGPGVIDRNAIAVDAIGADQIASNAITAGKISAGAVTTAKLDALAVNADKIAANAITADKILAGTITATQLNVDNVAASVVTSTYVTGEVISGTKIVQFYSPTSAYNKVVMGYNDPTSGNDGGVGIALYSLASRDQDTDGGSTYYNPTGFAGYLGTWGIGGIELATHYLNSYIDLNRGSLNTGTGFDINMKTNGSMSMTASSNYIYLDATRVESYAPITVTTASTQGLRAVYSGDTARYMNWSSRVASAQGADLGSRLSLFPGSTSWTAIYADGVIQYRTLSAISTRDSKFDITTVSPESVVGSSILDTRLVSYKFKQTDGTEDPSASLRYGVIAEEMVDLGLEELVSYDAEGNLTGVDYSLFGLFLIPIVKKLKDEIDELKRGK
jgi:hypothetical protein